MQEQPLYVPNSNDFVREQTRQLLEANDSRAQEELASLMAYLSIQMANPAKQAGTSAGKVDAAVQSMCSTSAEAASCYAQSSSGEPGSTYVGSRSASQTSSGNGTGSGSASGSGNGSTESGSGNVSGGSDGYCGDGSTGSGSDNISDGSDNGIVDNETQCTSNLIQQGRVKLPPGLADGGSQYLGMPMKVELASNLGHNRQHAKNKSLQEMLALFESCLQDAAGSPTTAPSTSAFSPGLDVDSGLEAEQSTSEFREMGELLQKVLLQVARTFPPEDTMTICSALASSLAAVLRNPTAMTRTQAMGQNAQLMQSLQKEIEKAERQRVLTHAQFTQNQASWKPQRLEQELMMLLQQELEGQGMSTTGLPGLSTPAIVPPLGAQHAAGLGLPPAMPPPPSQMLDEWQMGHLLRQELESGWLQPEAQFVTPQMVETGLRVSTDAAQRAAAAWQQARDSLAWQQQSTLAWQKNAVQQARESAASKRPEMVGPSPLHQMSDARLQLPRHTPSRHQAHMMSMQNFHPFSVPMPVPPPMQTAPTTLDCRKIYREDGVAKGQRKGAGKGSSAANKRLGRSDIHKGPEKAPASNDKRLGRSDIHKGPEKAPASNENGGRVAPQGGSQGEVDNSLRANLETLRRMDCNCIVQVRKINQLGFESAAILQEHFSRYGRVDRVLVSHCYAKARNLRFRPSGLGFVVMSAGSEVQAILADGPEIKINRESEGTMNEVTIQVQGFKPERTPQAGMGDDEA